MPRVNRESLTERINDVIWIYNIKLERFTYFSPSIKHHTGFTVEESLNMSMKEALVPESYAIVKYAIKQLLPTFLTNPTKIEHTNFELRQRCKDRSTVWIEVTVCFQMNGRGEAEILGVSRNIEQRKRAELELRIKSDQHERFFSLSLDLLCIADMSGRFVKMNKSWRGVLGYSIEELTGSRFIDYVHPEDVDKTLLIFSKLQSGKKVNQFVNRYKTKSGDYKWIEWRAVPYGDNLMYAAARDISERRFTEEMLRELSQELSTANNNKEKFISILAHDLKNPLGAIAQITTMLREEADLLDREELKLQLSVLNTLSVETYKMLEDILLWRKAENGNLPFNKEPLNIKSVMENAVRHVAGLAKGKEIEIKTDGVPHNFSMNADKHTLTTLLRNLLSNAVKFTGEGGIIYIAVRSDERRVIFEVEDNGVGMSQETLGMLWESSKFKSQRGTANEKGSGLGLVICKEIVKRHGGEIWAESTPGVGSKFSFSIPADFS